MEELIFALLVGLWKLLVGAYKKIRDWLQNRSDQDEEPRRQPSAERAPQDRRPVDVLTQRRQDVQEDLTTLEHEAADRGRALGRTRANRPLGAVLDQTVVQQCQRLKDELNRLPPDAGAAVAVERLASRGAAARRLYETAVWMAEQRESPTHREPLAVADGLARACRRPLVSWARHRLSMPDREPISFVAVRDHVDLRGFPEAGVAAVALPAAFPGRLQGWPQVAHEVGRDFLDSVQGLKWELRNRFGLPDRYPIPFASRGYLSQDEVLLPFGGWLEWLFGDLVGTLLLGPAYPMALRDLLASPSNPSAVTAVGITSDSAYYAAEPPAHLRMSAAIAILDDLGFPEEQQRIWESWNERHGWPQWLYLPTRVEGWIEAPISHFVDTAGQVADLIVNEALGALSEHSLRAIPGLAFSPELQAQAEQAATAALGRQSPPQSDPRILLAGVVLARERMPNRSRELLRWLRALLAPVEPDLEETAEPTAAAAAGEESLATLLRDAVILHAALNRPALGSRPAAR
ncbi:MAG: hypothetical protein ABI333_07905 [bacterium]